MAINKQTKHVKLPSKNGNGIYIDDKIPPAIGPKIVPKLTYDAFSPMIDP